jgi:L-ascorbate metabolism protein UlaG (beta-lactamase superfamily)
MSSLPRLTWLSQSGYLIEHAGHRLVIDPYLSDAATAKGATRVVPAPLDAAALAPDALIATHNHVDHWDPIGAPEILRTHPHALLLAPASVRPLALAAGLTPDRLRPLDVGETITTGPFTLTALPTLHSDPRGVGLLIRVADLTIYHSGDTEYTTALAKDLAARLATLAPRLDLALLCINGRLGNMTWLEAALLAETLRPRLTVPNHYDLFAENQADPAPFLARCALLGLPARTLAVGQPFTPLFS